MLCKGLFSLRGVYQRLLWMALGGNVPTVIYVSGSSLLAAGYWRFEIDFFITKHKTPIHHPKQAMVNRRPFLPKREQYSFTSFHHNQLIKNQQNHIKNLLYNVRGSLYSKIWSHLGALEPLLELPVKEEFCCPHCDGVLNYLGDIPRPQNTRTH